MYFSKKSNTKHKIFCIKKKPLSFIQLSISYHNKINIYPIAKYSIGMWQIFYLYTRIYINLGVGMGIIKTSFFVLLSTLFIVKRHMAHLSLHLGSFTGMLIIPPLNEFQLLPTVDLKTENLKTTNLKMALYLNLGLYTFMDILCIVKWRWRRPWFCLFYVGMLN